MADLGAKLRADAQANRERILDAARALTTDPEVSLNSIAKAAGVGAGTLYRHFPSREALVLGVYRKEIDALVAMLQVASRGGFAVTDLGGFAVTDFVLGVQPDRR